jgi:uncharacterized protein YfaT (DUF1175 family)
VKRLASTLLFLTACARPPDFRADRTNIPADGSSLIHLTAAATIAEGARFGRMEGPDVFRATILPGRAILASANQHLTITTFAVETDSAHDGTPDFLRLENPSDQTAFRRWFTYLAESQCFRNPLPKEVNDCAALIRYSYRHALSTHDDEPPAAAPIPPVEKYIYPYTPLGANLFRIRPGEFTPADLKDATFAQFADAETLLRYNAHLIGRNIDQAEPGDILWYRQLSQRMPFHTMVFIGASQLDRTPGPYVVYHTGPGGEMRRLTIGELLRHPDPRWRPFPANENFLGVYRWNIL